MFKDIQSLKNIGYTVERQGWRYLIKMPGKTRCLLRFPYPNLVWFDNEYEAWGYIIQWENSFQLMAKRMRKNVNGCQH
jgi:hypothetical protein